MSGARVHEYVQKVVVGLASDQKIRWRPDGDGSEIGLGDFRIYDVVSGAEAQGTVILESLQSKVIKSGGR